MHPASGPAVAQQAAARNVLAGGRDAEGDVLLGLRVGVVVLRPGELEFRQHLGGIAGACDQVVAEQTQHRRLVALREDHVGLALHADVIGVDEFLVRDLGDVAELVAEDLRTVAPGGGRVAEGEGARLLVLAVAIQHFVQRARLQQIAFEHDVVFDDRIDPAARNVGLFFAQRTAAARIAPALPDLGQGHLLDQRVHRRLIALTIGGCVIRLRQRQRIGHVGELELQRAFFGSPDVAAHARPVARQLLRQRDDVADMPDLLGVEFGIVGGIDRRRCGGWGPWM